MNSIEFDFMLDDRFHNENKKQLNVILSNFCQNFYQAEYQPPLLRPRADIRESG